MKKIKTPLLIIAGLYLAYRMFKQEEIVIIDDELPANPRQPGEVVQQFPNTQQPFPINQQPVTRG